MGVSELTFYRWKKVYAGMGVTEIRRLKQLEDENAKLKRVVADLTLDKAMLQDVLRKNGEACRPTRDRAPSAAGLRYRRAAGLQGDRLLLPGPDERRSSTCYIDRLFGNVRGYPEMDIPELPANLRFYSQCVFKEYPHSGSLAISSGSAKGNHWLIELRTS
jgi:hypothetical protein